MMPVDPGKKAIGMNTADSTVAIPISAGVISVACSIPIFWA